MKFRLSRVIPFHFIVSLFLVGCGGGGGDESSSTSSSSTGSSSSSSSITAFFSMAPVTGATCKLYKSTDINDVDNLNGVTPLASAISDGGSVTFPSISYTGPALIECSGGHYQDEASGVNNTQAPSSVRAVVTVANGGRYVVSLVTHVAAHLAGNDLSQALGSNGFNQTVADQFGLEGVDITTTIPTDLNTTAAENDDEGKYGLVLAALSQLDKDDGKAAIDDFVADLETDMSDGDGVNTSSLQEAVNNFVQGGSPAAANVQAKDALIKSVNSAIGDGRAEEVLLTSISLSGETYAKSGEILTIFPKASPLNATNPLVDWTSSNNQIATVDKQGRVTASSLAAVGTVTITATSRESSEISASVDVTFQDTTSPVITLLGANPLSMLVGTDFSEPGYRAVDNVDGDISGYVSVAAGPNSPSSVGTYTLEYQVSDQAGNQTLATRTVYVKEPPTAQATPSGGIANTPQLVTLSSIEPNSAIYYTLDGSHPTIESTLYRSPIYISTTTTLKYFSVDNLGLQGSVNTDNYIIDVAEPETSISPVAGTYNDSISVTLASDEASIIYYTLDGSTPTTASAQYSSPITIASTTSLKYFAVDSAGNIEQVKVAEYIVDSVAPSTSVSHESGTYNPSLAVTLTSNENSSVTYYTLDGSVPTNESAQYSSPINITVTTTLKYFSVDSVGNTEEVNTVNYEIDSTPPLTVPSPNSGTYRDSFAVTLSSEDDAVTYYTLDGSTPTTSSTQYSSEINISSTTTLKYFSVDALDNKEAVKTAEYVIDSTKPSTLSSHAAGLYNQSITVTLTSDENTVVYYTLDGSTPTHLSTEYSSPIEIAETTTLKYYSVDEVGNEEDVYTAIYVIDSTAPSTTVSHVGGEYSQSIAVTLTSNDDDSITYYTLDGTTPSSLSIQYSASINIAGTTTLKYYSVDEAGNEEGVQTVEYVIDITPPTTTVSPAAGSYAESISVSFSANEGNVNTYFTLDGSTPTIASEQYSSPVNIDASSTLKYFSVDQKGNAETVKEAVYLIGSSPSTTVYPQGGVYNGAISVSLTAYNARNTYYSVNGTNPSPFTVPYDGSEINIEETTTLKYYSVGTNGTSETIHTVEFIIDSTPPTTTASIPSGTYNDNTLSVTLTSDEADTVTYYTLDGSSPTDESLVYSSAISITTATTITFFSVDTAGNAESEKKVVYAFDRQAPVSDASQPSGNYSGTISVQLTSEQDAVIYYSIDGSTPTTGSSIYSTPFNISQNTVVMFFAVDLAGNIEEIQSRSYVFGDSDNDGLSDVEEIANGLNPNDNSDGADADSDSDGLTNREEIDNSLNPLDNSDGATADTDSDGVLNRAEIDLGMDPKQSDDLGGTSASDKKAFHVMGRLSYGPTDTLIGEIETLGVDTWINDQLTSTATSLSSEQGLQNIREGYHIYNYHDALHVPPTIRPMHSHYQLQTVMGHFWDNHFNTYIKKHFWGGMELWEEDQFYLKALGNFRELLGFSAKSAAMSRYLDGETNKKSGPNENYAREVMELHTMGVSGGYTDEDVAQLARILTGWTWTGTGKTLSTYNINLNGSKRDEYIYPFKFQVSNHDDGSEDFDGDGMIDGDKPFLVNNGGKVILSLSGEDGVLEGEEALDILASHSSTATFICTKLANKFISDTPAVQTINDCATTFLESTDESDQIAQVLSTLFASSEFNSAASHRNKIKDTQEYILGIGRLLGWDATEFDGSDSDSRKFNIGWRTADAEQGFFLQPAPTGWSEHSDSWNQSDVAIKRIREANTIIHSPVYAPQLLSFFQAKGMSNARDIVSFILPVTTGGYYSGEEIQTAYTILYPAEGSDFSTADTAGKESLLRELVAWAITRAEYNIQ